MTDSLKSHGKHSDEALEADRARDVLLQEVESRDLVSYGMIPEFIGRFPVNVALTSLNQDMLVRILTEPKNSLVSQYKKLFDLDGVRCD